MNPDEIKPGRTYEGADGERREVHSLCAKQTATDSAFWVEFSVPPRGFFRVVTAQPMNEFAAWAVREVES